MTELVPISIGFLALLLAASSTNAAVNDGQSFDLVCMGQKEMKRDGDTISMTDWKNEYRIDLGRNKYCDQDCTQLNDIAMVNVHEILLINHIGLSTDSISVNRLTGEMQEIIIPETKHPDSMLIAINAKCERSAFLGFPASKF